MKGQQNKKKSAVQNKQNKHMNIETSKQNCKRLMRQSGTIKRAE